MNKYIISFIATSGARQCLNVNFRVILRKIFQNIKGENLPFLKSQVFILER